MNLGLPLEMVLKQIFLTFTTLLKALSLKLGSISADGSTAPGDKLQFFLSSKIFNHNQKVLFHQEQPSNDL